MADRVKIRNLVVLGFGSFLLAACFSDPPCGEAEARRAAETFRLCVETVQQGDGGIACGRVAYNTHCRARRDR
jgi:hypothetical protein